MDRIEYLSQMGHIIMHIQLTKGQMAELRQNIEEESAQHSDNNDSTQSDAVGNCETSSSSEEDHQYQDRVIGITVRGLRQREFEAPEYKGKKCLVCKGGFNVKSKYLVCKFCDRLVHVNNQKKCFKMKNFFKNPNYVCQVCLENPDNPHMEALENEDSQGSDQSSRPSFGNEVSEKSYKSATSTDYTTNSLDTTDNHPNDDSSSESLESLTSLAEAATTRKQNSVDWNDATIDGVPCNGLIYELVQTQSNEKDVTAVETENFECEVCNDIFESMDILQKHIYSMHYEGCLICEKAFLRSIDKRKHIQEDHMDEISENQFGQNIERQSTLIPKSTSSTLKVKFVGQAEDQIKNKMKRKRRVGK